MGYFVKVVDTQKFLKRGVEVEFGAATWHAHPSGAQVAKEAYEQKTGKQCVILSHKQVEK